MYKVMIVDDESIIRRGIRNCVPWEDYGMEIAAEASNGQEALDIALDIEPDIVIADICMPEIDGLEMSERLLEINKNTKIIILTGYDEFEYAQRSVRLGVTDFILKPTNTDDLLATLNKIKKLIEAEKNNKMYLEELESKLINNIPLIRENYLIRLISGVCTSKDVNDGQKILNISENLSGFQIAILDYNSIEEDSDFSNRLEMLHFAVKDICCQEIDANNLGWTFYNERGQITILFHFQDDIKGAQKFVFNKLDFIQQTVNKSLKASFSIGVGEIYDHVKDVKKSYEEAKEALEYRFVLGENSMVFINDLIKTIRTHTWGYLLNVEKEIISSINKGNKEMVITLVEYYFSRIKDQQNVSPFLAKAKCYELAGNVILAFNDMELGENLSFQSLNELYNEIYRCDSLTKAVKLLNNFIGRVMEIVSSTRNTRMRKLIELGIRYINEHYMEEIMVVDIAEHLYVTPNYFSRLFKKETGEGCAEYINKIRIENAKELLKNPLNLIYQVADMVGFKDANYFSCAFKKYTGVSPKEYRDNIIE